MKNQTKMSKEVLKRHGLGSNPTYIELVIAQDNEKDINDLQVIFKLQEEYCNAELEYLKNKRKELQNYATDITHMRDGGHPFETIGFTIHMNQVIRVFNEKLDHDTLLSGGSPLINDEKFFYLNDNFSIAFLDAYGQGVTEVELHTIDDMADSFKRVYDIAVGKLKKHIEESKHFNEDSLKEEKAFYLSL